VGAPEIFAEKFGEDKAFMTLQTSTPARRRIFRLVEGVGVAGYVLDLTIRRSSISCPFSPKQVRGNNPATRATVIHLATEDG